MKFSRISIILLIVGFIPIVIPIEGWGVSICNMEEINNVFPYGFIIFFLT